MKGRIIMNIKIKNAVINLCLRESSYDESVYEETRDMLSDVDWSKLNIESSDFTDVYRFKAGGDYFLAHSFENEKMFCGKRAIKLHESVEMFTSEVFCSAEIFEIWLTADMKTEIVGCFRMDTDGAGGNYGVEYRYPIRGDFPGEFDIECFFGNLSSCYGINRGDLDER